MVSTSDRMKKVIKLTSSLGLSIGVLGSVIWLMFRNPEEVLALLSKTDIGLSILSVAALMAALIPFAYAVAINLRMLGYRVSLPQAGKAYFWSQLGKYVPGKILLFVIRGKSYANYGVPAGIAALSMTVEVLLFIAASLIVALAALLFSHSLGTLIDPVWIVAGLALTLVLCSPRVIEWGVAKINRKRDDYCTNIEIRLWHIIQILAINICGWLSVSLAFLFLINASMKIETVWLPQLIAAFPLAFLAGLVAPFAPGGLGIRELTLMGILAPTMGVSQAATIAIVSRCWWIVAELGCIGVFTLITRRTNSKSKSNNVTAALVFARGTSIEDQVK